MNFEEFFSLYDKMMSVSSEGHKLGRFAVDVTPDGDTNYLNPHLKRIQELLNDFFKQPHPFSFGGNASVFKTSTSKYELQMKLPNDQNWTHIGFLDGFLDATKIIPFCNIAPFGDLKSGKTVVDENVRKAWECNITNDCIRLAKWDTVYDKESNQTYLTRSGHFDNDFSFLIDNFLPHLKEQFKTEKLMIKPYKLNIYGEDGFFKGHVDTPTNSKTMIGTLVVCLPSYHKGGELILHKTINDTTYFVRYDFASLLGEPVSQPPIVDTLIDGIIYPTRHLAVSFERGKLPFVSFYSDSVHEVSKITKGHRMTLTFSLLIDEQDRETNRYGFNLDNVKKFPFTTLDFEKSSEEIWAKIESAIHKVTATADDEDDYECRGIGFLLQHNYTSCSLDTFTDETSWERLKNYDIILRDVLLAKKPNNFQIDACTIIRKYYHTEAVGEYANEDDSYDHHDEIYSARLCDFVDGDPSDLPKNLLFVRMPQHGSGYYLKHHNDDGAEHTGNETRNAEEEYLYFTGAILVYLKE